jgi:hypothetical protein
MGEIYDDLEGVNGFAHYYKYMDYNDFIKSDSFNEYTFDTTKFLFDIGMTRKFYNLNIPNNLGNYDNGIPKNWDNETF